MSLAFLQNIKVEDPSVMKQSSGGGRRKDWTPATANTIRIWKSGAVYPSQDLADRFNLEYGKKPAEGEKVLGNAFDIFSSVDFPIFKVPQPVVLLNVTPKAAGKSDLFGSTTYNDDGTPKSSVMDQGAVTFGKDTMLGLLKSMYGVEPNEKGYIDVVLLGKGDTEDEMKSAQQPYGLPDGKTICHVPKEISRGTKQGEMTYVRRENPQLFVLYPYTMVYGNATELTETATEQTPAVAETVEA